MLSTPKPSTIGDLYAELGVERHSTPDAILARLSEERERSNLLKRIPKRRVEAESRLARLAEIERLLTNPTLRAAYEAQLLATEESDSATPADFQTAPPETAPMPNHELDHFCRVCGLTLPDDAKFCEDCGASTKVSETGSSGPSDATTEGPNPDYGLPANIARDGDTDTTAKQTPVPVVQAPPAAVRKPKSGSSIPYILLILIPILMVIVGALWILNQKPTPPIASAPPIPGQVTDLRPSQVSLLSSPILTTSPVASWDPMNIHGLVTIKSDNGAQSILYPNGSQFTLDAKLFSASSAGSVTFSKDYGTVLVESAYPVSQSPSSTWQVQLQVEQAKDINGDGFPEIVLSDFNGGAHCCTTLAVISLRPHGPVVVFDQALGSGGAVFKDLDGDGRLEIRYQDLFEYALGSFAQGTFGIPVIYSAGKDGVYRVNTRAFAQLMSNEFDAAAGEHQMAKYDSATGAMEEDRNLIDMFFLAYLAGRRAEGFDAISRLKPLGSDSSPGTNPLAILEDALKNAAPEVLQEPEWIRLKSGQPVTPEPATSPIQPVPTTSADSANRLQEQQQANDKQARQMRQEQEYSTGVWADPETGLTWTKKDNGADVSFQAAFDYCRSLQLVGYSNWRLPTIGELQRIYDSSMTVPGQFVGTSVNLHVKGNLQLSGVPWSGSSGKVSGEAWIFPFNTGNPLSDLQNYSIGRRALCVKGVGSPSTDNSQTRGILHYSGPPVRFGETVVFSNLPGGLLRFTFDQQSWQPLISRQPNGTQKLTLRSLKRENQVQCDVHWEIVQ